MKKAVAVILSMILSGGVGGGLYYYYVYQGHNGIVSSSPNQNTIYVDSVRLLAGLGSGNGQILRYAGIVEPQETWSAKVDSDKTIKDTYVKVGDTVKVGDKLFLYDTTEDENNLTKNDIEIEKTKNEILTYQNSLEQYKKNKAAAKTEDEVLEWETTILSTENAIKQDEYELKELALNAEKYQKNIDNAVVKCQLAGVVQTVNSQNNSSSMDSGNADVYITVMAVGDYRVKSTLNEQNVDSVFHNEDMIVFSRVNKDQNWKGKIVKIDTENGKDNSSDNAYDSGSSSMTNSTNYAFFVDLETSEGLLLGQHVYIEQNVGQTDKKEGIWLPNYYFMPNDDGSSWVWASTPRNLLEKRTVTLGEYDEALGTVHVLDGLTEDDYIVQDQEGMQEGYVVTKFEYASDDYLAEDGYGDDFMDIGGDDMPYDMGGGAYEYDGGAFEDYEDDFGDDFDDDFEDDF